MLVICEKRKTNHEKDISALGYAMLYWPIPVLALNYRLLIGTVVLPLDLSSPVWLLTMENTF